VTFRFIREHAATFSVERMCHVLEVSRSGYHEWLRRPESRRVRENRGLLVEIRAIHKGNRQVYGSPRVHRELQRNGVQCGRNRVARIMRDYAIQAKQTRRFRPVTTDSRHNLPVAENVLQRNFVAPRPDQAWVADITYIPTRQGWLYLAVVLDLFSRKVVGWAMGADLSRHLAIRALQMALSRRRPPAGLIHHSDRGSQYASHDYQALLNAHAAICSMSRKGDCWDNAAMESFFHTLKTEQVHHQEYETRPAAQRNLFEYMEVFYNRQRLHSTLGYRTPAEFEERGVPLAA
jgi:putative transposase